MQVNVFNRFFFILAVNSLDWHSDTPHS